MSDVLRVDAATLTTVVQEILQARGISPDSARQQAQIWVEADLRGQPSHGVQRLFTMLGRIGNGVVNVHSKPQFTWTSPGVLVVDGDNELGPPIANATVDELVGRAHSQGVTIGLVQRTHHLGMLAPYVERMAERGCVGIASCTSEALVHAWGGVEPQVGTNPIAIAVPIDGQAPVSMDMSTGATSRGRILHHATIDEPLEPGWAVNSRGVPTTDPHEALDGSISPFGGPKGYALGVALEVLIAGLTGTSFGRDVSGTLDETLPVTKGDLFVCIDPRGAGLSNIGSAAVRYLDGLRASRPAEGTGGVWVPGDRARATRSRNMDEGIPLDSTLWSKIRSEYDRGSE